MMVNDRDVESAISDINIGLTPEFVAEQLAFPKDYGSADRRLANQLIERVRDYSARIPQDPITKGAELVRAIDDNYDPFRENTLEATAALVARHGSTLDSIGLVGETVRWTMLLSATKKEVSRARRSLKVDHSESAGAEMKQFSRLSRALSGRVLRQIPG